LPVRPYAHGSGAGARLCYRIELDPAKQEQNDHNY
jgi:hypothetical protein